MLPFNNQVRYKGSDSVNTTHMNYVFSSNHYMFRHSHRCLIVLWVLHFQLHANHTKHAYHTMKTIVVDFIMFFVEPVRYLCLRSKCSKDMKVRFDSNCHNQGGERSWPTWNVGLEEIKRPWRRRWQTHCKREKKRGQGRQLPSMHTNAHFQRNELQHIILCHNVQSAISMFKAISRKL
jgi:hypothetical protein